MKALGYFRVAAGGVDTAKTIATAIGAAIPSGTRQVKIQPEAQNIRYRDDGTNPTSAVGMLVVANDTLDYQHEGLNSFKIIAASAGAVLNISCYGIDAP